MKNVAIPLSGGMASQSRKLKAGGRCCCLPGCKSSTATKDILFLIPTLTGKRLGLSTRDWADKFHQVIFRYRCDSVFKRRVKEGKCFICSKHFKDVDIVKSNCKANLRFGSLPTVSLPKKSHETTVAKKRRIIEKHPLPEKNKLPPILSIYDVMSHWKSSQPRGWRMHQIYYVSVNLTYYKHDILHAAPSVSVLITEKASVLQFSVAYNGLHAADFSSKLDFGTKSLQAMLQHILDAKVCSGYESIPDSSKGFSCTKVSYVEGSKVAFKKRFFSDNCVVAYVGTSSVCQECMASHVKCIDNLHRRLKRKERVEDLLLTKRAPHLTCRLTLGKSKPLPQTNNFQNHCCKQVF